MQDKMKRQLGRFPRKGHISRNGLTLDISMLGVGDLYDYSGNGNDSTPNGPTWVAGDNGPALSFDGVSNSITIPDIDASSNKFTFICNVKPSIVTGDNLLIGGTAAFSPGFMIRATKMRFVSVGVAFFDEANTILSVGQDYELAVTYDGAILKYYLNGILDGSDTRTLAFTAPLNNIGGPFSAQYYTGDIARSVVYNCTLSAQEIKSLYDNPWQAWAKDNIALWAAAAQGGGVPPATGSVNLLDGLFARKRLIA